MMHDATSPPMPLIGERLAFFPDSVGVGLQRSVGRVELAFKRRGAVTTLAHLHQAGCGKARLPRPTEAATPRPC
jgi:hypothetical protein